MVEVAKAPTGRPVGPAAASPGTFTGVQSIGRAFRVLELVAAHGGVSTLSRLAEESALPLPTIHRLVRTLVELGYLRQEPSRAYALGPRLLVLAQSSATMLDAVARPHLARLVEDIGETANLALLDGDLVAYVAQVPGRHAMRMFTEVGRRVSPHCTAVGKALLAEMADRDVEALLARVDLPRRTPSTIVDAAALVRDLAGVRRNGYALDDEEQEVGVRCVAVAVPRTAVRLAMSLSGPAPRMTDALVARAVPLLRDSARALCADLSGGRAGV